MRKDPIAKFKKVISKAKTISIVTHWSPDGDAMGSSLGLYHHLKNLNKNVKVIVPNEYPGFLQWLPGNKSVINFQFDQKKAEQFIGKSDVIFTLDFNTLKRIDKLGDFISKNTAAKKIMVDHHREPDHYADLYFHDVNACSTCELIFLLIRSTSGLKAVNKNIATCLYTGIMTDTGNFRFPSVTAATHKIVAELIEKGADNSAIYSSVQDDYSESRMRLVGYCLSQKMKILADYSTSYMCLTKEELDKFRPNDTVHNFRQFLLGEMQKEIDLLNKKIPRASKNYKGINLKERYKDRVKFLKENTIVFLEINFVDEGQGEKLTDYYS
mgnify:CR=1 FL=1